jgi:hypothetical protein
MLEDVFREADALGHEGRDGVKFLPYNSSNHTVEISSHFVRICRDSRISTDCGILWCVATQLEALQGNLWQHSLAAREQWFP